MTKHRILFMLPLGLLGMLAVSAHAQQQTINIGTAPNAGDGDTARAAFTKVNDNFDELYDGLITPLAACDEGEVLVNASDIVGCVEVGTSGQVLTSAGAGNPPTFEDAASAIVYDAGTFVAAWTDGCSTTPMQTIVYTRVGNVVVMTWPNVSGCTGDTTTYEAPNAIPVDLRPDATRYFPMVGAVNGGASGRACLRVNTDGDIQAAWMGTTYVANGCVSMAANLSSWQGTLSRSISVEGIPAMIYQIDSTP